MRAPWTVLEGRSISVDLMKCLAILMVLMVHTGQLFKSSWLYSYILPGQLGCQIFFMISGFTLCMSSDSRRLSPKQFFLRRFRAIAPGYYFAILLFFIVTICFRWFGLPYYWKQSYSIGGLASNILLIHGLFPDFINNIVPGGWFIGTIALMYLTFPWVKHALEWLFEKNNWLGSIVPWIFGGLVLAIWVIVDNYAVKLTIGNNTFLYFSILTQYPCFIIGMILYLSFKTRHNQAKPLFDLLFSILLACVTLWLFYNNWKYSFSLVPLMASASCSFLLSALIKTENARKLKVSSSSWIAKISQVSYEMYLLHTLFCYYLIWYLRKIVSYYWGYDIFGSSCVLIVAFIAVVGLSFSCGIVLHSLLRKIKNFV